MSRNYTYTSIRSSSVHLLFPSEEYGEENACRTYRLSAKARLLKPSAYSSSNWTTEERS